MTELGGFLHAANAALRTAEARWKLVRATSIGSRPRVVGRVFVENDGSLVVGDDLHLDGAPLPSHLVAGRDARLVIGDRVRIGSGSGVAARLSIEIGDDVEIGDRVLVMDSDFHGVAHHRERGASAPIVIEAGARVGDDTVVLKGSHIAAGTRVPPGSVVRVRRTTSARRIDASGGPAALVERALGFVLGVRAETGRLGDLPGWDTLAALRVLVALEDAIAASLPHESVLASNSVASLVERVAAARVDRGTDVAHGRFAASTSGARDKETSDGQRDDSQERRREAGGDRS